MIAMPAASVLLRWVLPGHDAEDTHVALALCDEAVVGPPDLVVPQRWVYEVGDTLAGRFSDDPEERS